MKNDPEIQQDVMSQLKWQPSLTSTDISVAVKNGIVTLSGIVNSYYQNWRLKEQQKRFTGYGR